MDAKDRPHAHALRKGRVSESGRIYLVTTVTHERRPVFANLTAARTLINTLRCLHGQNRAQSLAFVLMPDHLHWLMELGPTSALSTVMRLLKGRSANAVNRLLRQPSRRLWQPGFHDHAIRREEDLRTAARYVVANPLRAGLVSRIGDYPHWDAIWL